MTSLKTHGGAAQAAVGWPRAQESPELSVAASFVNRLCLK